MLRKENKTKSSQREIMKESNLIVNMIECDETGNKLKNTKQGNNIRYSRSCLEGNVIVASCLKSGWDNKASWLKTV